MIDRKGNNIHVGNRVKVKPVTDTIVDHLTSGFGKVTNIHKFGGEERARVKGTNALWARYCSSSELELVK